MTQEESDWKMGAIQLAFVVAVISIALFASSALKPPARTAGSGPPVATSAQAISVSVSTPRPETYRPVIRLNGVVQSQTQISVSPQVGGRVIKVGENFRAGADLQPGDLLFQIDPVDFRLAIEQADVNIKAAASDLALLEAEAKLARQEWEELFPGEPISELAARGPQVAAAQARLDGAKAAKKTAQLALSRTRVTTTEPARVLSTALTVGQVIAPNQVIGQTFALDSIEVSAPLTTQQLEQLLPVIGRDAILTRSNNPGEIIDGVVARVDATLDPRTRLASVFISPEADSAMTIGSFVDVEIAASAFTGALRIPQSALAGRDEVWIVEDDKLARRRVMVIGESGDDVIIASTGIGQGVLTLPLPEAEVGQVVKIRGTDALAGQGDANAGGR